MVTILAIVKTPGGVSRFVDCDLLINPAFTFPLYEKNLLVGFKNYYNTLVVCMTFSIGKEPLRSSAVANSLGGGARSPQPFFQSQGRLEARQLKHVSSKTTSSLLVFPLNSHQRCWVRDRNLSKLSLHCWVGERMC